MNDDDRPETRYRFGEETSRRVEAIYRTADVVAQRERIRALLALRPGERVLDVGSGPGMLAREMAEEVGERGRVTGVDLAQSMLDIAGARCAGLPSVSFERGDAKALPFADGTFDAAVVAQVYEYVDDIPAALRELRRVLAPGGRALVVDTDWHSILWHSADPDRMRRVLTAWDGHLAHPVLPRTLTAALRSAGFEVVRREVFPMFNPEYDPDTYSHGMVAAIRDFVTKRGLVDEPDASAWAREQVELGERGEYFFRLDRYVFVARRPPST